MPRQVGRGIEFSNLNAVISVGYRVGGTASTEALMVPHLDLTLNKDRCIIHYTVFETFYRTLVCVQPYMISSRPDFGVPCSNLARIWPGRAENAI